MKTTRNSQRERGMTLVEILVAVAILAIAMVVALSIYDLSRKSYKKGENVSEQQQAVRIAFDQLVSDLRMTGFNYNPDGNVTRPDEQFEAAFDTAVVIRADFDAEDPVASLTPESTLGGTTFLAVSTGNDEIYAYALAKPDGSSADTLSFQADVQNAPRDGVVETVNIPNVAMVHDDPPYTLYRISLNNDVGTWGGAGFFTRTPLIDNVYSMSFRYYNKAGLQANTAFDLTSIAEDIGGVDGGAAQDTRKELRRVGLELVGMTPEPDLAWVDEADIYAATRRHRKFALAGDITPRNMGMVGVQDISSDVTPPSQPGTPSPVPGHCGGLWVSWAANPAAQQVAYYRLSIGTTSGNYTDTRTSPTTSVYVGALADATTYYLSLQAVDASGNQSIRSAETSVTTSNLNTPEAPLNLTTSTDLNGAVRLSWDQVTDNTASQPAADPYAPNIRDLAGYRVYRGAPSGIGAATMIADESVVQNRTTPDFTDVNVVNCRSFHYWVTAVDTCGRESGASAKSAGNGTSVLAPMAPTNLQAFFAMAAVRITWDEVDSDINENPIFIDTYNLYRSPLVPVGGDDGDDVTLPALATFTYVGSVSEATHYRDTIYVPDGYTVYYYVIAVDDCGNASAPSDVVNPDCAFVGDVVFRSPGDNTPVAGVVPIVVGATHSAVDYENLTLEFIHEVSGAVDTVTLDEPGPEWRYEWLANPPGPYTIIATITNDEGCAKSETIHVAAGTDVGCCLSPPTPDLNPIVLECVGGHKVECASVEYEIINNNCLTAVAIEELIIDWQDVATQSPHLTGVFFDSSPIWNVSPPSWFPAVQTFSDPKPSIDVSRNTSNPVTVRYTYDANMSARIKGTWYQNTLTTSFGYRLLDADGLETAITGTCGPSTGMFNNMIVDRP